MARGDPGGAKCAGTWNASATGVTALSESFLEPLVAGDQKASLASLSSQLHPFRPLEGSLAWGPSRLFWNQVHKGAPLTGVLIGLAHQALKGAPWVASYCVVQCIRHLMGQPLYCSAASAGLWGERLW